jgi:NADPH-dependent 2,4-dienoyl-CoA reductase/sulfur reductase-like enzyme
MTHFALTRRHILASISAISLGAAYAPGAFARVKARIAIVGGGFGGATATRSLKRLLPNADITLVEPSKTYIACPFSNLVISGDRSLSAQLFSHDTLVREGITVIQDSASGITPGSKVIHLANGADIPFDRAILSPGIAMRWGAIDGYTEDATTAMPHAWKAGSQTARLRQQLHAMEDGGLVVMSIPAAPYRCPPGPYERASLIAHYLKTKKPKSKLILLDAKDSFSKQPLFMESWQELYGDTLEWRSASDDGRVSRVDSSAMTIDTDFETFSASVANIIPPQKANTIAERAGVADATGWCPVNATSFESTLQPGIHVIGDASIAAPMPKSAFSANLQAKVCAIQVARLLSDLAPEPTTLSNTCYSYLSPDAAISIAGVYTNENGAFASVAGAGGLSPEGSMSDIRHQEAREAADWFDTITRDAFG